ncbi:hypothetical protein ACSNOI_17665 [Actinomadura kijaniata]|uniref:hypothetical protein n=1 Tax=Actinomadura kijaniata TaxID=46161 RepID=UPI003F1C27A1
MRTMRWARRTWQETSPTLRTLAVVLWSLGAILLALGWWGDTVGFWQDRPFLTNVASSLVGAAFGVPLALVVLQQLATSQAEAVEARAARRLASQAAERLMELVEGLWGSIPGGASRAVEGARQLAATDDERFWEGAYGDPDRLIIHASRLIDSNLPNARRWGGMLSEIAAQWEFLNGTARTRVLETTPESWRVSARDAARMDQTIARLRTIDLTVIQTDLRRFRGDARPRKRANQQRMSEVAADIAAMGALSDLAKAFTASLGGRS